MPLRDHFRPPLSARKSWEAIHGAWAVELSKRLNRSVLSPQYESESRIHHGTAVEIDVATYHDEPAGPPEFGTNGHGGTAVAAPAAAYAAPAAVLAGAVSFVDQDVFEVQVYRDEGGMKLVAAVELVSPANKDRPSSRRAFATKVAAYLQQGISVVAVDVVTTRLANLHAELIERLRLADGFDWHAPSGLAAVAYRVVRAGAETRLEAWPFALAVGEPLPTVPLWLNPVLAVPLELEPTYEETCDALRIR